MRAALITAGVLILVVVLTVACVFAAVTCKRCHRHTIAWSGVCRRCSARWAP